MKSDWERMQDLLVAVDARLHAFTDREVRYYLRDEPACMQVSALMFIPKVETSALLMLVVSKMLLAAKYWDAERLAQSYVHAWLDKVKLERAYANLHVEFNEPPAWAKTL